MVLGCSRALSDLRHSSVFLCGQGRQVGVLKTDCAML
jgi:hypothetical protein